MGLGVIARWQGAAFAIGLAIGISALAASSVAAAPLTFTFRTTLPDSDTTFGSGWFSYDPTAAQAVDPSTWELPAWEADKIVFWSKTAANVVPNSFRFGYHDPIVGALDERHVAGFHFEDRSPSLFALNVLRAVETTTPTESRYESFFLTGATSREQTGPGVVLAPGLTNGYDSRGSSRFVFDGATGWVPETPPAQTVTPLVLRYPQPVPEPAGLSLFGVGLLGFARFVRSRFSA